MDLDNVMWSLVHELRISIIFPALILLVRWNSRYALTGSILFGFVIERLLRMIGIGGGQIMWASDPYAAVLASGYFVPFFVAGICLANHRADIARKLSAMPILLHIAIFAAAWSAFAWPTASAFADVFYGPAACAIIVLAMSLERAKSVLETTPILWLGKISYSLYLLHVPILLLAIHLLYGHIPILAIVTLVVVGALVASDIAYRCIAAPAITLGSRLSAQRSKLAAPIPVRYCGGHGCETGAFEDHKS